MGSGNAKQKASDEGGMAGKILKRDNLTVVPSEPLLPQ